MPTYTCNHCGESVKNNGGTAREIGMFLVYTKDDKQKYYHADCAKEIVKDFIDEI